MPLDRTPIRTRPQCHRFFDDVMDVTRVIDDTLVKVVNIIPSLKSKALSEELVRVRKEDLTIINGWRKILCDPLPDNVG